MTKSELLEKLKDVPFDAKIVVFDDDFKFDLDDLFLIRYSGRDNEVELYPS
jgi:hypothetical protein